MWNDVVEADPARGIYKVCGKFWNVGTRYTLHEHIGAGSYGDVCRATDCLDSLTVALKRVADVLCCPLLAKRVLREVCIMRRLSHPYLITLTNVFTSPSIEVEGGIDLYIATEFADGGDMYHMNKPLSPQEVKFLMWQLLTGMSYIHSCRVWHRDIKSENILLTSDMSVKICDFGLSRSAEESTALELQTPGLANGKSPGRKSLRRQYTKMVLYFSCFNSNFPVEQVVTPSYRAPEVIMSRGQYSSAIDIWSLGCIFWELLTRCMDPTMIGPPGKPLFGVREEPVTPRQGENYTADEFSPLHDQLDVIFDVIGTPGWNDIENVPSESWRSYLKHLPGRAGSLTSQLIGRVDQEALDLLLRMLAFNPNRRCTAEEALSHIYFKSLGKPNAFVQASFEETAPGEYVWKIKDPAVALEILERELETSVFERDGGRQKLEWLLQQEIEQQQQQNLFRQSLLHSFQSFRKNAASLNRPAIFPPLAPVVPGQSSYTSLRTGTMHEQQLAPRQSRKPAVNSQQHNHRLPRITRSSSSGSTSFVELPNRTVRGKNNAPVVVLAKDEQTQVRRSPRLKDLQAGELPHRKRLCLKAG